MSPSKSDMADDEAVSHD